jgi:hypothetical protein
VPRLIAIAGSILAAGALLASACGGSSKKDATATPAASASAAPAKTASATAAAGTPATGAGSPATAATSAIAAATPEPPLATPADSVPPPPTGKIYTQAQAKALLDDASLKPVDVGADWLVTMDLPTDNAAAAAADPVSAASIERCGRLAGRLLTNGPKDTVSAYLGGSIVAAFSQLTVYATAAGAADCAAEGAVRYSKPGELARAFGKVFVNPDAVVVKPVEYPQTGDGSFATALTGDINAAGTVVQLQIVIVAFLKGNVTAVVGVAYAPLTTPSTKELKPFVDLVLQRITANQ